MLSFGYRVLKCDRIQNAEVSDTTGDAIKSEAGKKIKKSCC